MLTNADRFSEILQVRLLSASAISVSLVLLVHVALLVEDVCLEL